MTVKEFHCWGPEPFDTLKQRIVEFAWPGGYPVFYLDGHNDTLCAKCARESEATFCNGVLGDMCDWCLTGKLPWEHFTPDEEGWVAFEERDFQNNWSHEHKLRPHHQEVNYEDDSMYCAECNKHIKPAYGDDD